MAHAKFPICDPARKAFARDVAEDDQKLLHGSEQRASRVQLPRLKKIEHDKMHPFWW